LLSEWPAVRSIHSFVRGAGFQYTGITCVFSYGTIWLLTSVQQEEALFNIFVGADLRQIASGLKISLNSIAA